MLVRRVKSYFCVACHLLNASIIWIPMGGANVEWRGALPDRSGNTLECALHLNFASFLSIHSWGTRPIHRSIHLNIVAGSKVVRSTVWFSLAVCVSWGVLHVSVLAPSAGFCWSSPLTSRAASCFISTGVPGKVSLSAVIAAASFLATSITCTLNLRFLTDWVTLQSSSTIATRSAACQRRSRRLMRYWCLRFLNRVSLLIFF